MSPQSGVVTDLKFHTQGGVVTGEPILTIIPQDDALIVETQLAPQDIDVVHEGLQARVRLLAYKARTTPTMMGRVKHVSPDRFVDQNTGQAYYIVRIDIPEEEFVDLDHISLYPGMPAEALIVTGKRTFFNYIMDPISKSFRRSMRED